MMAKFLKVNILFFIIDNILLLSAAKTSYRRSVHDQDLEVPTNGIHRVSNYSLSMLLSCI